MMFVAWLGSVSYECKVIFLSHFESIPFVNEAPYYAHDDGYQTLADPAFGAHGGTFDSGVAVGTSIYVALDSEFTDFNMPFNGDLTVEYRIRRPGGMQLQGIGGSGEYAGISISLSFGDDVLEIWLVAQGSGAPEGEAVGLITEIFGAQTAGLHTDKYVHDGLGWTDSEYHAIAVCFTGGNTLTLLIDGQPAVTQSFSSTITAKFQNANIDIRCGDSSDEIDIDEARLTLNEARYSGVGSSGTTPVILDTFTAADGTDPTTRDIDTYPAAAGMNRWRFTMGAPNTEGRIVGNALTFQADANQGTGEGYVFLNLVANDASSFVASFPYALAVEAVNEYAGPDNNYGGWIDVRLFSDSGDGFTVASIFVQSQFISAYADGPGGSIASDLVATTPGTVHKLIAFIESDSLTFIANGAIVGTYTSGIGNTDPINMVYVNIVPPIDNSVNRLNKIGVYSGITIEQATALTGSSGGYTPATGAWVDATCDSDTVPPSNATLLLHFEGADGSTTINDSSPFARVLTGHDACKISTARSKWGGSSLRISRTANNKGLDIAAHTDFACPANSPFWIEFWIYHVSSVTNNLLFLFDWRTVLGGGGGSDQVEFINTTASPTGRYVYYNRNPSPETFPYPGPLTSNAWHHIAVGSDGLTLKRFLNGVEQHSTTAAGVFDATRRISIGGFHTNTGTTSDGSTEIYIDELRFLIGSCPFTSDFTPPTGPYT